MKNFYMKFYIADYLADTSHLSTAEHGAYLLLIMHSFRTEKPLNNDDSQLARICKMSLKGFRQIKLTISQFFIIDEKHWTHKRVLKEISEKKQKSEKCSESGKKSAESKKKKSASVQRPLNYISTDVDTPVEQTLNERSTDAERTYQPVNSYSYSKEVIDRLITTNNNSGKAEEKTVVEKNQEVKILEEGVKIFDKPREVETITTLKPITSGKHIRSDEYWPVIEKYYSTFNFGKGEKMLKMSRYWTEQGVEPEDIYNAIVDEKKGKNRAEGPFWFWEPVVKYAKYRQDPVNNPDPKPKTVESLVEKNNQAFSKLREKMKDEN